MLTILFFTGSNRPVFRRDRRRDRFLCRSHRWNQVERLDQACLPPLHEAVSVERKTNKVSFKHFKLRLRTSLLVFLTTTFLIESEVEPSLIKNSGLDFQPHYRTFFFSLFLRHNQISDLHKQNLDNWRKSRGDSSSSRANSQVKSLFQVFQKRPEMMLLVFKNHLWIMAKEFYLVCQPVGQIMWRNLCTIMKHDDILNNTFSAAISWQSERTALEVWRGNRAEAEHAERKVLEGHRRSGIGSDARTKYRIRQHRKQNVAENGLERGSWPREVKSRQNCNCWGEISNFSSVLVLAICVCNAHDKYRVFHRFRQAKFGNGGWILSSSQF